MEYPVTYENDSAYTSLSSLQGLRHLAKYCKAISQSSKIAPLIGHYKTRALGRGMEFEEVRQYQSGDDVRTIDWRVTARTQVTHVKRYTEEKEKPVVTAVDQRQSLFFGSRPYFKSVHACHIASILSWATLSSGDRSGGVVLGNRQIEETRPARHHKTVNRWLQQLSQTNQSLTVDTRSQLLLCDLLQHLLNTKQTGRLIYIISDFYDIDPHCEALLFELSRHQHVRLFWVYDQLETALPKNQRFQITDGQDSYSFLTGNTNHHQYQHFFKERENTLTAISQKLNIPLHKAPVQMAAIDICQGIFTQ